MKLKRRLIVGLWATAALSGIFVSRYLRVEWLMSPGIVIVAVVLAALVLRTRRRLGYVCVVLSGVLIGLYRGEIVRFDMDAVQKYSGSFVQMVGVVDSDPQTDSKDQFVVIVHDVKFERKEFSSLVRIVFSEPQQMARGDRIVVSGKLSAGFGGFAAAFYRPKVISVERLSRRDYVLRMRDAFGRGVQQSIGSEAGLGLGFLTGQKVGLATDTENNLRTIGLSHIIVASGYNLTILVQLARWLMRRFSRFAAAMGGLAMTSGFMLVTGFSPSMSRAGIVAVISLASWYYGRRINPAVIVLLSAVITGLMRPVYVWGDLGWYLSFLSFAGVLLVAPLLTQYFFEDKDKPHILRSILLETTSALLMTLPLTIYVFGTYSPLALIANAVVLPFVPLGMLLTFVAGIAGAWMPVSVAHVIGWPAKMLLGLITRFAAWFANLPFASADLKISRLVVAFCYGAIALGCWYIYEKSMKNSSRILTD